MQLSVLGLHDIRGCGGSTLVQVAHAVEWVVGHTMDGPVVPRLGSERPGLR